MNGLHIGGVGLLAFNLAIVLAIAVRPLWTQYDDDKGDGRAQVALPPARRVPASRVIAFYIIALTFVALLFAAFPGFQTAYRDLVERMASLAYDRPDIIKPYTAQIDPTIRAIAAMNFLGLAAVIRATPLRRLTVCVNSLLFAALMISVDVAHVVVCAVFQLPVAGTSVVSSVLLGGTAAVIILRLMATTFELPRASVIPIARRYDRMGNLILGGAFVLSLCIVVGLLSLLQGLSSHPMSEVESLFIGLSLVWTGWLVILLVALRPIPLPPAMAGSITIITPAFNEESVIAPTLRAMDRAAQHCGGDVTVLLIDDGSTDRTAEIARATMSEFVAARGRVLASPHLGKAAALNQGLATAETEIVVRIDADVIVSENAFAYLAAWFTDPQIGMVGGFDLPHPALTSMFARGRLFECVLGYAFSRVTIQRLDAINCIPGTFTAFRAAPALAVGGFVTGMNGEDADLTQLFGRLGYRVVLDHRIRVYEDVPGTVRDFREQRVRWGRAGVQNLSRHSPLKGAPSTPRSWYFYFRTAATRTSAILRPLVIATTVEIALLSPHPIGDVALVIGFYALSMAPTMIVISVFATKNGLARELKWLPLWLPFGVVRRFASLESLLTLPTREVFTRREDGGATVTPLPRMSGQSLSD